MNTLQMKQKMIELAVSDKYMADACGVGLNYFRSIFNGSRQMTGKLRQKIEHVFNTLMIKPKSAEEQTGTPKPKYVVDASGKIIDLEKEKVVEEKNKVEQEIEFYRGKVGGLFNSLDIIREQVQIEERTYSQGFVMMVLNMVRRLGKDVNDLVDAFEKRNKQ